MKVKNINELVQRASKVISHYWPMTTFVHHNPIRDLESLPFNEAIKVARRFIGGQGYLANKSYRDLVKSGRISSQQLDKVLENVVENKEIKLGKHRLSQIMVIRAHFLEGITAPTSESISAQIDRMPNSAAVLNLAQNLSPKIETQDQSSFIARNISLSTWCDQEFNSELVWQINSELIKWCEAFMDEGHASWSMPEREKGFYAVWKSLASQEWLSCGISNSSKKISALPESAEEALVEHLEALAIPQELWEDYISLQLTSLYGWASFINWRSEHPDYQWQAAYPIDLVQYLAVRLFYERELVEQHCQAELGIKGQFTEIIPQVQKKEKSTSLENTKLAAAWRLTKLAESLNIPQENLLNTAANHLELLLEWLDLFPETEHGYIWLMAHEAGYQENLIEKIKTTICNNEADKKQDTRALAQMMFCIDVRSEPFRKSLETVGHYETIGFAGFFGIPISCRALDHQHETDQCPAILEPQYNVHEIVREGQSKEQNKHDSAKNFIDMLHEVFHDLKSKNIFTPYILVEALGWLFGLKMLERTIFPGTYRKWHKKIQNKIISKLATKMTADKDDIGRGLTTEEQNSTIETVLKMMGLTKDFARLVVVAGHTSISDNNPYEAALNCGACGGNSGEPNARLFVSIANKPEVRTHLAQNGIEIPQDTYFIAAVHNTTTDDVELFDLEDLPSSHQEDVERLKKDLRKAAVLTNQKRCLKLPGTAKKLSASAVVKEINRRSADWSETRPEWGLSGNASFIIGKRTLTQNLDLEGRTFLNSYDYQLDSKGSLLEGILMGPMVVGQWINAEHYFSATDPEVYGSGSKIYHNVVGHLGIMSGPQSDLRTGLAWQSVTNGNLSYHEPLRLFVIIEAPYKRINEIIEKQSLLKQLCDNEWIHLMAIDHENENKFHRYVCKQGFTAIHPEAI